jgi:CubicO group peptidase (beta-lactamase class C family)
MNKKPWFIPAKALLIFLYLLCFSKAGLTSPVGKGPVANAPDEYLSRIVPYGFSGAVLVAKDDRVILNKGYGMAIRAKNIPNTETTVLNTGSITKQFTAAAIMKLEMPGKLNTPDAIGNFFEQVPTDKKNITLHHLLTHTAGIADAVGDDYAAAKRDETITKVLKEPLQFTPGEEFSYSNAGEKNEFAGYHLPLAKTILVSFKTGKERGVEGLTVYNDQTGKEFFAKK